jgi:hypothetical protein
MQQVLVKTEQGQTAFKARSAQLAGKLRSAYLLFDGQRSVQAVLQATQGLGVCQADIEALQQAGLLAEVAPALAPAQMPSQRTPQERYRDAYPLAVRLTGGLGLSGFRLNLSVEAATSFDDLAALAPKLQQAVGTQAFAPLAHALFG